MAFYARTITDDHWTADHFDPFAEERKNVDVKGLISAIAQFNADLGGKDVRKKKLDA